MPLNFPPMLQADAGAAKARADYDAVIAERNKLIARREELWSLINTFNHKHQPSQVMDAAAAVLAGEPVPQQLRDMSAEYVDVSQREDVLRKSIHAYSHRLQLETSRASGNLFASLRDEINSRQERILAAVRELIAADTDLVSVDDAATAAGYSLPPLTGRISLLELGADDVIDFLRRFVADNTKDVAERRELMRDKVAERYGQANARSGYVDRQKTKAEAAAGVRGITNR